MIISEEQDIDSDVVSNDEQMASLLDDRIGAFTAYTLAADLLKLREIYTGYLQRIPEEAWTRRTERRPHGWTLLETLAHLDAMSSFFNTSIEQAITNRPITFPGMTNRSDLRAVNRAAIDERLPQGPAALIDSFLDSLAHTARLASNLSPNQLSMSVEHPYFSGNPSVAEMFGTTLTHIGIIHGGQVAMGAKNQTIWSFYDPRLMRRQLTRAFHTMGLVYWPERGGTLHATFVFNIEGQGGGSWFVRIDPNESRGHIGTVRTADVTVTFASADLFCRVVTLQTGIWRLLLLRKLRLRGNLRLATRMSRLFILT